MYARGPIADAYRIENTTIANRSTILGIYYFGSIEGGGLLAPVLGYLIDQYGFYTNFTTIAAFVTAVSLVCSLFLMRKYD